MAKRVQRAKSAQLADSVQQAKKAGGPFLSVAGVCETVLDDSTGMMSVIHFLDQFQITIPKEVAADIPSEVHPIAIALNLLLMFKSGSAPGVHPLLLEVEQPNGKRGVLLERDVELSATPSGGVNIKTVAELRVFGSGLFWLDVTLGGKLMTRIPIDIVIKRGE